MKWKNILNLNKKSRQQKTEITDEEKKKLIEQGRMEAMNTIQKSLKPA